MRFQIFSGFVSTFSASGQGVLDKLKRSSEYVRSNPNRGYWNLFESIKGYWSLTNFLTVDMIYSNIKYLRKYNELPLLSRYFNSDSPDKILWGHWNWTVKELVKTTEDELNELIGFIWFSFNFSLISKSVFQFSRQNYNYCEDHLAWLTRDYCFLFRKIFFTKGKFLIDLEGHKINEPLKIQFDTYSVQNLETYTTDFMMALSYLDQNACFGKLNHKSLLQEMLNSSYFTEEFSADKNSVSFKYLELLLKKITEL